MSSDKEKSGQKDELEGVEQISKEQAEKEIHEAVKKVEHEEQGELHDAARKAASEEKKKSH